MMLIYFMKKLFDNYDNSINLKKKTYGRGCDKRTNIVALK